MAAITLADNDVDTFNWTELGEVIKTELPSYARPLFIRIQPEIAVTSTFKHQKMDLVKQGYNLSLIEKDIVYFYNLKEGRIYIFNIQKNVILFTTFNIFNREI
jgi:fatty-acyl-CoA synthase